MSGELVVSEYVVFYRLTKLPKTTKDYYRLLILLSLPLYLLLILLFYMRALKYFIFNTSIKPSIRGNTWAFYKIINSIISQIRRSNEKR